MRACLNFLRGGDRADDRFQLRAGDSSGTEQRWVRIGQRQHGGFDAYVARAAIEDVVHFGGEAAADVVGGGGRQFAKAVRARSGERDAGGANGGRGYGRGGDGGQFAKAGRARSGERDADGANEGERYGMRGHAESDGGKVGGHDVGNCSLLVLLLL